MEGKAVSKILTIAIAIVIILVVFVTLDIATSGSVTKTEYVLVDGYQEGQYVVSGTCTFGPTMSLNVTTHTTNEMHGIGFRTRTTTTTLYGISSILTTTTLTNTTSLGSNCTS